MLGRARTAMSLTARGAERQSQSVNNLLALINRALALGKSGKPHCGFECITGQGNSQGEAASTGKRPISFPATAVSRTRLRASMSRKSGASLPLSGTSAYEMLDSARLDGGVRAMLVLGSNVAVSAPNLAHIRRRLSDLDFLVVADFFISETARLAHVVLPSAQWAEEEGTVTNLQGRVILRRRAAMPPARVRTDLEILSMLAERLGCAAAFPTEAEGVFEELRRASAHGPADYSGISYKRLESHPGVFWPPALTSGIPARRVSFPIAMRRRTGARASTRSNINRRPSCPTTTIRFFSRRAGSLRITSPAPRRAWRRTALAR